MVILLDMAILVIEGDFLYLNQNVPRWLALGNVALAIGFRIELISRLYIYRAHFLCDRLNLADILIDLFDVAIEIVIAVSERLLNIGHLSDSASLVPIRLLRTFRLVKLARTHGVLAMFPEMNTLKTGVAGVAGSLQTILWIMIMLGIVLVTWSMVALPLTHPLEQGSLLRSFTFSILK